MRRICLTLPTNRPCSRDDRRPIGEEAAYAAEHFDVEVHLLILDSSDAPVRGARRGRRRLPIMPDLVLVHHLDEAAQRDFLTRGLGPGGPRRSRTDPRSDAPGGLSYGACTNRAFLIGAALGCESCTAGTPTAGTRC
jgi:hypothetical protein